VRTPGTRARLRRFPPRPAAVNQVLGLSRQERRKLRAMIHQESSRPADAENPARIDGKLAWVSMLNPKQAEALQARRRKPSR
jgi:RNA-directed DNA polymerase